MMTVKDCGIGKEYKFEHIPNGVELLAICYDHRGDKLILGTTRWCDKVYQVQWTLDGKLWLTHSCLDGVDLDLTPYIDLKPCPFCDSNQVFMRTTADDGNWYIDCACCKVFVNTYTKDKNLAIRKWNMRKGD